MIVDLAIKRRFYRESAALEDVGVGHGGFDIFVPEQFLYGADVVSILEEMCGEGVSEGVGCDTFIYFYKASHLFDCFLNSRFMKVVSSNHSSLRFLRQ